MSTTGDYGKGAHKGQDQSTHLPAVIPGGLYTRRQLIQNLRVSPNTIDDLEEMGLRFITISAKGKFKYYLGDDVLDLFKTLYR